MRCLEFVKWDDLDEEEPIQTTPCPKCGGGGFSGYGTGYDDVCDECGGRGEHPIEKKEQNG